MAKIHRLVLDGKRFGRWVVTGRSHTNARGEIFWHCKCDCGNEGVVRAGILRRGESSSCGCYHQERITRHGMSGTKTWKTWDSMLQRCENPNSPDYHRYGGRGIAIDPAWREFERFFADMGTRPIGKTLDRKNVNLGYFKDNCQWATDTEQQRNRQDAIMITWRGETRNIHDWAESVGLQMSTLKNRLGAGWPVDVAMTKPARPKRPSRKEQTQ